MGVLAPPDAWRYKSVDLSLDPEFVISAGPALLKSIYVEVVISAQPVPFIDGSTTIFNLIASLAAGELLDFDGMLFETSLKLNSDDTTTGTIIVLYRNVGETS